MNEQVVLVCEHHHNDMVFFRYEWPRLVSAPPVLILETGAEALAYLRRCVETYASPPSLVICELHLPHCSGLEVLSYIKSTTALHHIPVVITSEFLTPEDRQQASEMGAVACWRKPISLEAIRQFLEPGVASGYAS